MMGDTISSDVSMADAESPREGDGQGQAATLDDSAATAHPAHPLQRQRPFSERRHHLVALLSRMSSRMSTTRPPRLGLPLNRLAG